MKKETIKFSVNKNKTIVLYCSTLQLIIYETKNKSGGSRIRQDLLPFLYLKRIRINNNLIIIAAN